MIDKILVALDGSQLSEEVLPIAAHLAGKYDASIELLRVVDEGQYQEHLGLALNDRLVFMIGEATTAAGTYLAETVGPLKDLGVVTTTMVAIGAPARAVLERARYGGVGLVAMTTHGRSGLARWTLGSTTEQVLRESTVPLLVYRAEGKQPAGTLRNVLLPLDGSHASELSIPHAVALAKTLGVPLTVARATQLPFYAFPEESTLDMAEVVEAVEQEARAYLNETGEKLRQEGLQVETRPLRGEAASQLIELAHRLPDSIVVMSTAGRTGIGRMVLGSVADRVVRHSERPVMLVPIRD